MTDKTHDMDDHAQGAEHAYEMQEQTHADAWQGEPIDDFSDEPTATATVSDESDDGVEADDMAEPAEGTKKRGKLLPIVAVVGGLLLIGTILYTQVGKMFGAPLPAPAPVAQVASTVSPKTDMAPVATVPPVETQKAAVEPHDQGGAASAPMVAGDMPEAGTVAPVAVKTDTGWTTAMPAIKAEPQGQSHDQAVQNQPAVAAAVPIPAVESKPIPIMAQAAPDMPATAPAEASLPAPALTGAGVGTTATASVSAMPATSPVPAFPSAAPAASMAKIDDARMAALVSRVDELQKMLDHATQQLQQMSAKLITLSPAHADTAVGESDRLAKLEQRVMQMEHTTASESPITVGASASSTGTHRAEAREEGLRSSRHHSESASVVSHRTKAKKAEPTRKIKTAKSTRGKTKAATSSVSKPLSPVANGGWVLRAASQNQAWVAKDATSAELRPVQVGDDLAGIGRIVAIRGDDASGWVLQGTKGSVH